MKSLIVGVLCALNLFFATHAQAESGWQTIRGTRVFTEIFHDRKEARFSNDCGTQTISQRDLQQGAYPDEIIPCPRPDSYDNGPTTPRSGKGVVTFKITNKAPYIIKLRLMSATRIGWMWPNTSEHWVLDDGRQREFRVSCEIGEKICYGGAYREDDSTGYWGLGFTGNQGCTSCCLACGTEEEDKSHAWNLNE